MTTTAEPRTRSAPDTNGYTAANIEVLEGLEAVRRRPGMYIGSTDRRGLHHLIYEIVDNAIDEAMAGFCETISVTIHADGSVTVEDDGRGIPVDKHEKTGLSGVETVLTVLHAGGKFGGGGYKVSGGLHGVGASVVNALSSELTVEVASGGALHRQVYRRGIPDGPLGRVRGKRTGAPGTRIHFLPDPEVFETLDYEFATLAARFREMAYLTKGIWIHFTDERGGGEHGWPLEVSFFFDSGVEAFVRHVNRGRGPLHPEPIYMSEERDGVLVEVALQYNSSFAENVHAFANCIKTIDGGSHLTGFRSALTRALNDYARRQKLLKDQDANLSGDDVREGLAAVISVKLAEPQFEGQTKTRLGNPEVKGIRRVGGGEGTDPVAGGEPGDRPARDREGAHRLPGPRGRPARHAISCSARGSSTARRSPASSPTARSRTPSTPRSTWSRGTRRAARRRARATAGRRRSSRCAGRS